MCLCCLNLPGKSPTGPVPCVNILSMLCFRPRRDPFTQTGLSDSPSSSCCWPHYSLLCFSFRAEHGINNYKVQFVGCNCFINDYCTLSTFNLSSSAIREAVSTCIRRGHRPPRGALHQEEDGAELHLPGECGDCCRGPEGSRFRTA